MTTAVHQPKDWRTRSNPVVKDLGTLAYWIEHGEVFGKGDKREYVCHRPTITADMLEDFEILRGKGWDVATRDDSVWHADWQSIHISKAL